MTSRILLINPNTSADMTRLIVEQAAKHVPPGVAIDSATASFGASVIASRASYAIAAHAALDCFARHGGAAWLDKRNVPAQPSSQLDRRAGLPQPS